MPSVTHHQHIDAVPPEFRQLDQPTQTRIREFAPAMPPATPMQVLKRSGQRPFLFNGTTMATICGVTPNLPFWYELNVHKTVLGSYLSDIRLFHKSEEPDLFWVVEHDDTDDLVGYFERYHPAADLTPPQLAPERASSSAELALWAAGLHLQVEQITQHYRALVGELLYAIHQKPA